MRPRSNHSERIRIAGLFGLPRAGFGWRGRGLGEGLGEVFGVVGDPDSRIGAEVEAFGALGGGDDHAFVGEGFEDLAAGAAAFENGHGHGRGFGVEGAEVEGGVDEGPAGVRDPALEGLTCSRAGDDDPEGGIEVWPDLVEEPP